MSPHNQVRVGFVDNILETLCFGAKVKLIKYPAATGSESDSLIPFLNEDVSSRPNDNIRKIYPARSSLKRRASIAGETAFPASKIPRRRERSNTMSETARVRMVPNDKASGNWLFENDTPDFSNPGELVTFLVGEKGVGKEFKVHKEFITEYCPSLKAAFHNLGFVEGQTQTYRLEDVQPSCFKLFTQWIYTQDFKVYTNRDITRKGSVQEEAALINFNIQQDKDLAQLWILADKFLMPALQDGVIEKIIDKAQINEMLSTDWISQAWKQTGPDSVLRKLVEDMCIHYVTASIYCQHPDHFPHDLLIEIAARLTIIPSPTIHQPITSKKYSLNRKQVHFEGADLLTR